MACARVCACVCVCVRVCLSKMGGKGQCVGGGQRWTRPTCPAGGGVCQRIISSIPTQQSDVVEDMQLKGQGERAG
jgi:hypothetical protein